MFKGFIVILFIVPLTACISLPDNNSSPSYTLEKSTQSKLVREVEKAHKGLNLGADQVSVLLLDDGIDAFVARLSLIKSAQSSLDLQYYLYHSDLSGGLLTTALWQAAERGVRVRLLVDDMDLAGKDQNIAMLSAHPNFEVRIFNPFIRGKNRTGQLVTQFGAVTRRMHNKSFTVDNTLSILGGRNIGDVYFGADPDVVFGDLDVAFSGPAVQQVSASFDLYWNNQLSYPIELLNDYQATESTLNEVSSELKKFIAENKTNAYIKALQQNNLVELLKNNEVKQYAGTAVVLYDDPLKIVKDRSKKEYHLAPQLSPYFKSLKKELVIVSPYFVPGVEGMLFFEELIAKGIEVKILTNSLKSNDVSVVHAGYSKYRNKLLKMGVKIYEMDSGILTEKGRINSKNKKTFNLSGISKASLHAKYFVLDRRHAFIGSLNLDPRSFNENTEIGVVIDSRELADDIAANFDDNVHKIAFELSLQDDQLVWIKLRGNRKTSYYNEPYSSWWDRFVIGFLRLLPGESQL
ncbi:phospholipase D family protein [Psychromonas aquimarina]|uniref:phospholipase D family protein n=1 Tax=Psychromonas aquimarina TaxID=444919 RepID=UPI0003FBC009|nr:phospholipase D family protein [Psychromonas aquimarina]